MVCTTDGFKFWSKQKWFGAKVLITTDSFVAVVVVILAWMESLSRFSRFLSAEKSEGNAFGETTENALISSTKDDE
jgi:hypothetical protein